MKHTNKAVVWLGGDAVAIVEFFIYDPRRSYEVRSTTTLWRPQIRDKRATSDVHDIIIFIMYSPKTQVYTVSYVGA